ncbi:MAG: antitoxin [Myxococcota bacterium]
MLVRNLDEATVRALKARAAARGRSLEQELRLLLTEAAQPTRDEIVRSAESIRRLQSKLTSVDLEALVREDRDR